MHPVNYTAVDIKRSKSRLRKSFERAFEEIALTQPVVNFVCALHMGQCIFLIL